MTRIGRVYIAAHRRDLRLTRICVTSVRQWYPDIPIFLLKDEANGAFCTKEIEELWNVKVWPTEARSFGWGFIKLEPLFDAEKVRYLILDSDIVFLGRVIDALERFDADFVVQEELQPDTDVPNLYFDPQKLRATIDPAFTGPAFTFNSGQYVATSGLISRADFGTLVAWSEPRRVAHPEMFNPGDQGVLNYVVLGKVSAGSITVARTPFMKWGREEMAEFDVAKLDADSQYPYVIHWAGLKQLRHRKMLRADILQHFERTYYARLPNGSARLALRLVAADVERWYGRAARFARRTLLRAP